MRRYGASPVHLLAHLALLPVVAWALLTVLDFRAASNVVLWLVAAVILHDLVLLPAYSLLDRLARTATGSAVNYVRVPRRPRRCSCCSCSGARSPARARARTAACPGSSTRATWGAGCSPPRLLFALSGALYLLRRRTT